jgi:hypothetical protein
MVELAAASSSSAVWGGVDRWIGDFLSYSSSWEDARRFHFMLIGTEEMKSNGPRPVRGLTGELCCSRWMAVL